MNVFNRTKLRLEKTVYWWVLRTESVENLYYENKWRKERKKARKNAFANPHFAWCRYAKWRESEAQDCIFLAWNPKRRKCLARKWKAYEIGRQIIFNEIIKRSQREC